MKKVNIVIFIVLLCLLISKNAISLAPPIDFPCVCCPIDFRQLNIDCIPPDILLSDDLETRIGDMSQTLKELSQDSKSSLPISIRMNVFLKKIKNALRLDAEKCNELVSVSLSRIDELFAKLQTKGCDEIRTRKCIPQEVLDEFIPRLQEPLEELRAILAIDDDDSNIPDVCRG